MSQRATGQSMTDKYLEEYAKYKHIVVEPGLHRRQDNPSIKLIVSDIDLEKETAIVKTASSGLTRTRTLHWIRKNLTKVSEE